MVTNAGSKSYSQGQSEYLMTSQIPPFSVAMLSRPIMVSASSKFAFCASSTGVLQSRGSQEAYYGLLNDPCSRLTIVPGR
ncbi:unnamed protein product [Protopolystoma xenopodis]|uniref:Uncharacterized protein n=1 Tax=Protopolystoma xenopodis TaxID=117903 RepID=A0A448XDR6_9PLAT|nr:unnamed protein product [Protopolystoma xenopodis]